MRCCAEVVRVLRAHSLQLLTILEVVIHDPLYKWSLSPNQMKMKQQKQQLYAARGGATNADGFTHGEDLFFSNGIPGGATPAPPSSGSNVANKRTNAIHSKIDHNEFPGAADNSFDKDAAERTIGRIKNKLQGIEDSASEAFSIEGQLEFVVNEAQDPANLSKIYFGWAPWL